MPIEIAKMAVEQRNDGHADLNRMVNMENKTVRHALQKDDEDGKGSIETGLAEWQKL